MVEHRVVAQPTAGQHGQSLAISWVGQQPDGGGLDDDAIGKVFVVRHAVANPAEGVGRRGQMGIDDLLDPVAKPQIGEPDNRGGDVCSDPAGNRVAPHQSDCLGLADRPQMRRA